MVLLGTDYVFDVIVPVTILNRYFLYRYGSFAGPMSNRRLIFFAKSLTQLLTCSNSKKEDVSCEF